MRGVAAAQRVIIRIADRGRVLGVIAPVMLGDLARQPIQFFFRFGGSEFLDRLHARLRAFLGSGVRFRHQPLGGGAGFVRDIGARQHARDFFQPRIVFQQGDAGLVADA